MIREYGRRFSHRGPVHSSAGPALNDGECRVCHGPIVRGALVLSRAWHVERAHVACGWLCPEEKTIHQASLPESFGLYWQWQCPECQLDAVALKRPDVGADLRCGRCRLIEVGCRVHLVRPATMPDRTVLPPTTAGVVKEIRDKGMVLVALDRPITMRMAGGRERIMGAMMFGRELLRREPVTQGGGGMLRAST